MRSSLMPLVLSLGVITLLGLTTILSIFPELLTNQIIFFAAGLFFLVFISQLDRKLIRQLAPFLYLASLLFLLLTFVLGSTTRGSVRWIDIGPFRLQSSELSKPMLLVFFASQLSAPIRRPLTWLLKNLFFLLLPVGLIFLQPDLGSSLVISAFWFGMLLSSKLPKHFLLGFFLIGILLLPLGYFTLADYQKQRLHTFVNPFSDPTGSGYNVIQAMIAVGSGNFLGKGVRQGTQSHLKFLPERHTDFAFASFAEEFGFVGVALLLLSFLIFLNWLLNIASLQPGFTRLLVLGAFWLFFTQTIINIGMNMGILPVTGITLPFVSYGGSSILSSAITLGIVLSLRPKRQN